MRRVVGEMHSDAREQVLEALPGHQVAVRQRRLAEDGELGVAGTVHANADAALVQRNVAHFGGQHVDGGEAREVRSEERREGKECGWKCRSRWSQMNNKDMKVE